MGGRLPTIPEKANTCSCDVATLAKIVKAASREWIKKD
jgi:hypothetical protein